MSIQNPSNVFTLARGSETIVEKSPVSHNEMNYNGSSVISRNKQSIEKL